MPAQTSAWVLQSAPVQEDHERTASAGLQLHLAHAHASKQDVIYCMLPSTPVLLTWHQIFGKCLHTSVLQRTATGKKQTLVNNVHLLPQWMDQILAVRWDFHWIIGTIRAGSPLQSHKRLTPISVSIKRHLSLWDHHWILEKTAKTYVSYFKKFDVLVANNVPVLSPLQVAPAT